MKLLDDIVEKIELWEDQAKTALGVLGETEDEQIEIKEEILAHHRQEICESIDQLNAAQATEESRLDDELISPEEREEIEKIIEQIGELIERLHDLL